MPMFGFARPESVLEQVQLMPCGVLKCTIHCRFETRNSADIAILLVSTHRGGLWGAAWMSGYQNSRNFAWVGKGAPVTTFPHEVKVLLQSSN